MVVGAGYIGLEVAEGLLKRGLHVTVVERLDAPMGAVLDADMAADFAGAMRAAGIDLRLGTAVTGFTVLGGRVAAVEQRAESVEADIVVIGLGVRPTPHWRARRASAWASPAASRLTTTCAPTALTSGPLATASNHTIG